MPDERWVNVGRIHDAVGEDRMLFIVFGPATVSPPPCDGMPSTRRLHVTLRTGFVDG